MSYFDYPSRYFADDKDIADILLSGHFSIRSLLKIGFRKGLCLSGQLSKEALVEELRMIPFSWSELTAILSSIESEDRPDKTTTCKVQSGAEVDVIEDAIQTIKTERQEICGEAYTSHTAGNRIFVTVKYSEINQSHTRVIQHVWKTLEITFEKSNNRIEVEYPNIDRANKIVTKVLETLPVPEGTTRSKPETINLTGIGEAEKSTLFYIELLRSVQGYSTLDVVNVRMHKDEVDDEKDNDDESGDDNSDNKAIAADIKDLVKDTTLSGRALLVSPHFRQFRDEGFAVMRISWLATEETGEGKKAEFQAEFKGDDYQSFCYSCRWVWRYDEDGVLIKRTPSLSERAGLNKILREAAFKALNTVKTSTSNTEAQK